MSGVPDTHYLVTDVSVVHQFANRLAPNDAAAAAWLREKLDDNKQAHDRGEAGHYLAENMPSTCKTLHIVYNPSGNHWVHARLDVDDDRANGQITAHNSMPDPEGYWKQKVELDLPFLAKLVSQRPWLEWTNVKWGQVSHAVCAQQANSDDCGPIAIDTARRSIFGEEFYIPRSRTARLNFGALLRWRCLSQVARFVTDKAYHEPDFEDWSIVTAVRRLQHKGPAPDEAVSRLTLRSLVADGIQMNHGKASVHEILEYIMGESPEMSEEDELKPWLVRTLAKTSKSFVTGNHGRWVFPP